MKRKQSEEIEKIKFFISNLINKEQDTCSRLINDLGKISGKTYQFNEMHSLITQLYDAKRDVLEATLQYIETI